MVSKGYTTTEFWLSLVAQVVPILVLTGVLDTENAEAVKSATNQVVEAVAALVVAVAPVVMYIYSRAKIKAAALEKK